MIFRGGYRGALLKEEREREKGRERVDVAGHGKRGGSLNREKERERKRDGGILTGILRHRDGERNEDKQRER